MQLTKSEPSDAPTDPLVRLGFTELEAAVYVQLLSLSSATGYRLAKAVGKAAANVYQALGSLADKGAVLVDEDPAGRTFRATAPDELLGALTASFTADAARAAVALERIKTPASDDRVYHLNTVQQTLARARVMIDGAREILLLDLFPKPAEALWPEICAAEARGVLIAGLIYADPPADLAHAILYRNGDEVFLRRWPGQQLTIVADAREQLTALWSRNGDAVIRASWSDSDYLACLQHSGLASEIRVTAAEADGEAPLGRISLLGANPPGLRRLLGAEAGAPAAS